MSKQITNKASNPMSPHSPKIRAGGSVVKNQATGKGGFRPTGDTHTSTCLLYTSPSPRDQA